MINEAPRPYRIGETIHDEACRYCGCFNMNVEPGSGPHAAQLRCVECDRHIRWLSRGVVDQ